MQTYEKLGSFFLDQSYERRKGARHADLTHMHIRDAQRRRVPEWL